MDRKIGTKNKRRIYILLAIILGMLLAVIAAALIDQARITSSSLSEELPESVIGIFLIGGMMLGYVLGVRWWQIVYVEKRHWRRWKGEGCK